MYKEGSAQGSAAASDEVFVGTSDMARLMRGHDWAATPMGPPQQWPTTLKVALRLLLTSRFEMWLGWGPDIRFFYNDAYVPTLGLKHPRALGTPTQALWSEIWDDIKDRIEAVYARGEATWDRALLLILQRAGYPEETYHTFSYSPLIGDTGRVEGLFCAVTEDTDRVISERRLATLRELAAGLAAADTRAAVVDAARAALATATRDLPFSILYLIGQPGRAELAAAVGIERGHPFAPPTISHGDGSPWPLGRVESEGHAFLLSLDVGADVPAGPWQASPTRVLVVPVMSAGGDRAVGFLVAGLSPYRPASDDFLGFVRLFAGQISASLANVADFERHVAERDRLRALFDVAPSFFCVLSGRDHVFELANASYKQLIGRDDIEGLPLAKALPEVATQGFVELLDDVFRSGRPYVGRGVHVELAQSAGAPLASRYLDFVYQPIVGSSGAVESIFVEGYDVTDKLEAENALRALNVGLEERIAARTRDLADALDRLRAESQQREAAQEALRHANKMEAIGQLTGGIAHDFNNLLQGITGSLELIKLRMQLGRLDNMEKLIAGAMTSAQRAASMTHRLLAFSRRQPLAPKPLHVNQLVAPMEDLLRRTVGENIRVEFVLAGGLWSSLCDASQLESALLNLCINARDAMPRGGDLVIETSNATIDADYGARNDVRPGEYVRVNVTDTGEGMTPDVLAKAFDPFFTTKPIGQGTGLGLSMVYGFVKQSHGHIQLDSAPGRGTTVSLFLPRHGGDAVSPELPSQLGNAHRSAQGEVLLVVEDEPVVRALVVDVLRGLGYRTLEAVDGLRALDILQSDARVDLLVTDVGLPLMNGRQVYDAAVLTRPQLKVLFMTGYAEKAALAADVLGPGMELITKPFAMEALATRIQGMLRHTDEDVVAR